MYITEEKVFGLENHHTQIVLSSLTFITVYNEKKKKNALEIKQCLESLCYVFCLICSTNVIGFVAQRYKGTSRLLHLKSEKSSTQAQLPFVYMVIHYTPTNPLTHTNP